MTVGTDTADKEMDATDGFDFFFVALTLCLQVGCITVEDMDVFFGAINVVEEVVKHKVVVALRMAFRQTYVFVHIESDHVLKAYPSFLICFYQVAIHANRSGAGGQS